MKMQGSAASAAGRRHPTVAPPDAMSKTSSAPSPHPIARNSPQGENAAQVAAQSASIVQDDASGLGLCGSVRSATACIAREIDTFVR